MGGYYSVQAAALCAQLLLSSSISLLTHATMSQEGTYKYKTVTMGALQELQRDFRSPVKSCVFKEENFSTSTKFLSRERSALGVKVRSIKASIQELGSVDVLISRCYGSIHPHLFKFNNFQCIHGLNFWVHEKCPIETYKPPNHILPCVHAIPYNFYSGLSGTLFTHIIENYHNLANFTISLKDSPKKLYMRDALLNLKLHLSTVKRCTGFINLSEQPVLVRNYRIGRSFRPVSFMYGKHIPELCLLDSKTFLRKTTDENTRTYCKTFTRYTCKKCIGTLIALRQQILLSKTRILRYPRAKYLALRNWTYTRKQKSSHVHGFDLHRDKYGFEHSYSIIFTYYQAMSDSIMRKMRRSEIPVAHCYDSAC